MSMLTTISGYVVSDQGALGESIINSKPRQLKLAMPYTFFQLISPHEYLDVTMIIALLDCDVVMIISLYDA